jgi:hypothetical protein
MSSSVRVFVEGATDEPFAQRVVEAAGHAVHAIFPMGGHAEIDKRVRRWCGPTNTTPMMVLRDLDPTLDTVCAPALVNHLIGGGPHAATTVFRIAEHEVEAWLLADRAAVASFFQVDVASVPPEPDLLPDPKEALVNVCRNSAERRVRHGMVPGPTATRKVGPQYTGLVLTFGASHWDIERARNASPSLDRAIIALSRLP